LQLDTLRESEMGPKLDRSILFRRCVRDFEVPTGHWTETRKRIDFVAVRGETVYTAEMKLTKWREALAQAFTNLFFSNYSYVALWHEAVRNVNRDLFEQSGIGLLEVNGKCFERIKPRLSTMTIPEKHKYLLNYHRKREEQDD